MATKKNSRPKTAAEKTAGLLSDAPEIAGTLSAADENAIDLRQLAKSLEQQVEHRISVLGVLHDVTIAANEAKSFDDALKAALERICHYNGWAVGHAWRVNDDGVLISGKVWQCSSGGGSRFDDFRNSIERIQFPLDDGFIGEVIRTGREKWVDNLDFFESQSRQHPRKYGLRSAVAFPVLFQNEPVAILEFFSEKPNEPDERFLEI